MSPQGSLPSFMCIGGMIGYLQIPPPPFLVDSDNYMVELVKGLSTALEVARAEIKMAQCHPNHSVRQESQVCGISGRRPGDGFML